MRMFKTHHKKMLLQGVADLQRMVTDLRLKNEQLKNELNEVNRDLDNADRAMHDMMLELRKVQLQLKIKTESYERLIGG